MHHLGEICISRHPFFLIDEKEDDRSERGLKGAV